ncbi:flavin reductase family protein [Ottowia thiooxydans]|uniref:flavin reductase family protein n=1 Tax=Ottowia thiooxydans TaxID=219182 RepID=UPI0003FD9787|nr:flavin reductase family protein [Ottowia thiooxydans]
MTSPYSFESVDLAQFGHEDRYKFLMASVIPRPIALVTTLGADGFVNAAPFSSFVVLSVDPPLLGISVARRDDGSIKDTYRLVEASGEFVIHTVDTAMAKQVQQCSAALGPTQSEVEHAGLYLVPSIKVKPPRIAQAPIHFECKLHRIEYFGDRRSALIVGEVVQTHSREGLVHGHRVDPLEADILGRLGGGVYCSSTVIIKP